MESASLILGIIAVIGLLFLLRWLIPSKGKVGEKVVAGKLDHLVVSIYGNKYQSVVDPAPILDRSCPSMPARITSMRTARRRSSPRTCGCR